MCKSNSLISDQFERQTEVKVISRQEMGPYPIIIRAWAHNKDDNK